MTERGRTTGGTGTGRVRPGDASRCVGGRPSGGAVASTRHGRARTGTRVGGTRRTGVPA